MVILLGFDLGACFVKKGLGRKRVFPSKWAFSLLIPLRNVFFSPQNLIERLSLKEDSHILEIGPGPGYFSPYLAKKSLKGRLVLFDIQKEMLIKAQNRLKKYSYHHVEFSQASGASFPFLSSSFDRIVLVMVLGEIENQLLYLEEIKRVLKPGGFVSITERWGDSDFMNEDQILSLFKKSGFLLKRKYKTRFNLTLNFEKEKNE